MQRHFHKMHGLGNDFVIVDARPTSGEGPFEVTPPLARAIADRRTGIGCDQLIVLDASDRADLRMRIWNPDGGEVESCGNATRCVVALTGATTIETAGGVLSGGAIDGEVEVTLVEPRFGWADIPLAEPFHDTTRIELQIGPIDNPVLHSPSVVNVGNPHAIFWVKDVTAYKLDRLGSLLENHPIFPDRANISLAEVTSRTAILLRTWERGAGLTEACGSAACAAAVCAVRKKFTGRKVTVTLPGGSLDIDWRDDDHIHMTGPAEFEYAGRFDIATAMREGV